MLGGGECFRQNTRMKQQFKRSQRQIKILLTSYVHDCLSTNLKLKVFFGLYLLFIA
jgi:hypothetical protein